MSYVVQTNSLAKIIDGKEIVKNVNLHVRKGKSMVSLARTVQVKLLL